MPLSYCQRIVASCQNAWKQGKEVQSESNKLRGVWKVRDIWEVRDVGTKSGEQKSREKSPGNKGRGNKSPGNKSPGNKSPPGNKCLRRKCLTGNKSPLGNKSPGNKGLGNKSPFQLGRYQMSRNKSLKIKSPGNESPLAKITNM